MDSHGAARAVHEEDGSPSRHLALLELAPVGLFETDADGNCRFVNRRWCELAGMTPEQAWGTGWVQALHPEDRDRVSREWYEAATAGREFVSEYRFRTPAGRVTWLQGRAAAVRDEAGDLVGFVGTLADISDRKAAEADRDRRAAELQAIYDAAPVGINVAEDPGCRVITGNRALSEMLGMPYGENVSKSRADAEKVPYVVLKEGQAIPADGLPMQRAARDGVEVRDEILDIIRGDGSRITVLVNADPVRDQAGGVTGAVGICADVTALRESERLLSLIYDSSSDCLYLVRVEPGEQYRFLSVNETFLKTSGYARPEVVGRPMEDVVPPPNHALVRSKYREVIETRRPVVYFETADLPAGRRHAEIALSPILGPDGAVANILGTIKDVTAREEAAEVVRRNEAWLRLVTDSLPALVGYVDRELRYRFVNASYEEWFGLGPGEVVGRSVREVLGEAVFAHRLPYIEAVLRGEPVRFEGPTEHVRLGRRQTEVIYRPHREDGCVAGFFVHVHDITQRKWAEEELRRLNAELREADRRKDEFLATLAHELRNPLAPIRNAVQILKADGRPEAELAWSRDMIERQVRQMVRLVDDLLDVSRITPGKLELRRQRIDLAEVLDAAVETSRPLIDAGHHELTVALPAGPVDLEADPTRLAQVFSNLLNNAAKYTEPGGHIWLTAERDGGEVVVSVRDTGIGIAAGAPAAHLRDVLAGVAGAGAVAGRAGHRPVAGQGAGRDARRHGRGPQRRAREGQRVHRPPAGRRGPGRRRHGSRR